jgi:hypothetical protein
VSGLDHDHQRRETGDQPVAPREVMTAWTLARRELGEEAALRTHAARELAVRPRPIDSRSEHRERRPPGVQSSAMSDLVDAACQATDDDDSVAREEGRDASRLQLAVGRGRASADDGRARTDVEDLRAARDPELAGRLVDLV